MELGVDLGTSSTVAFLRRDDGTIEPVLFDGAPLLPSAVHADPGGELLVGRDALHAARARPERFEGNPKRRIDDGTVFLGAEVAVESLLGALLRRVAAEARRIGGAAVTSSTVTHPAAWGAARRATLQRAAAGAGLGAVRLVPEPVAAAAFHLRRHGAEPADLLVYDLGAGTFDVAVVRHSPGSATARMEVLCSAGLDDTGGQDVDAAIVGLLRSRSGAPELWARLDNPATVADRAARRQLWEDVRNAKEMLSRTSSATLYLPLLDTDQLLTRDELERLAAPLIQRTVNAIGATLAACPVPLRPLGAVILVGGATRMPLVATMLHRALDIPPTIIDQPELVVAAGSLDPMVTGRPGPAELPAGWTGPVPLSGGEHSGGLYLAPASPASPGPMPAPASPPGMWHPVAPPAVPQPAPHGPWPPTPAQQGPAQQGPAGAWRPIQPPAPHRPPPPVAAPPPAGVTLTIVELLELTTPRHEGVTLRGQLHGGYGVVEHVFPTDEEGRLLVFPDTAALARYAARDASDPLIATPPWQVRAVGSDDQRYNLDLIVEHLSGPPDRWLPSFVCRCRDLCAQLAVFLGLAGTDDLIGEHSTIDRVDAVLRRHPADVTSRGARRRLARIDQAQLVEDWTDLLALIDAATVRPR
ncbi:Hsp70 family protein [Dactylosporangium roseum]|uniref:Hsp70 family protein n=1 Tax=Dactylosporangium roseum TaxID=47989 RepID=A0ABY5YWK6_9ACTN|nr:hsp70 family protein [Dactylosporangium roseum]UWZ34135.1 Hsp70 family protein [Dactylosporangium roseum]